MKDDKSVFAAILLNLFIPGIGYMYLGRIFLGFIVLFVAAGSIALTMGIAWFPLALIMTIDMLLLKNKRERDLLKKMKQCPECAEMIQSAANVCRYCNHNFKSNSPEAA